MRVEEIKIMSIFESLEHGQHIQFLKTCNGKVHTLSRDGFLKRFGDRLLSKFEKKRRS